MNDQDKKTAYLDALREVVDANGLSCSDIMEICGKPERTVFYWLSGKRAPDEHSLLMLHLAMFKSGKVISRSLSRIVDRNKYGMTRWVRANRTGERIGYAGEKINRSDKGKTYIYHNELLSITKIAEKSGVSFATCYSRIIRRAKATDGSDVTTIIDAPVRAFKRKSRNAP